MYRLQTTLTSLELFFDTEFNSKKHHALIRSKAKAFIFLQRLSLSLFVVLMGISFKSAAQGTLHTQEKTNNNHATTVLKIGVLGDSLSAAYNLKIEQGWVSLIEQRLNHAISHTPIPKAQKSTTHNDVDLAKIRTQLHTDLSRVEFFNASISGATTDAGLQVLPSLLQKKPDIVFLELGANDGLQGKPIAHITRNLSTMIGRIQQHGGKVVLLGMHLPPNMGKRYTQPFFEQYKVLSKQYGTEYIPFLLEGVAGDASLMMKDGLHPNIKGQKVIADTLWPTIQRIIMDHISANKLTKKSH